MTYEEFIQQVAARGTVPHEQAATLTDATLETLAERISGGEAQDVASQLPDQLAGRLRKHAGRERAESFPLAEFVRRVCARTGMDEPTAQAGIAAVLSTLRQAVPWYEVDDITAQLPADITRMFQPTGEPRGRR